MIARAGLVRTWAAATTVAVGLTMATAALASVAGVDFEVGDERETIPMIGIGVVVAACSLVGLGIAAAVRRWTSRPAALWWGITAALVAISLIPPLAVSAAGATRAALIALHLVPAAIVIPAVAGVLGRVADRSG